MKSSKLTAILTAISVLAISVNVNASILGSTHIDGYSVEISKGTTATHNKWYSDQEGVGQQTENYITYAPNEDTEPIMTFGDYIFGATKIESEIKRLKELGINPIAGTNADFFSLQTGVPMSNAIVDGKILTKDGTEQYGIGFLEDNSAFMSKFTLYSVLKRDDGTQTNIYNINKYRQPYSIYMMTEDFSDQTHNTTKGIDVILGSINGEMKIGTEMTAVVEAVDEYEGSIAIPKGKIVLTADLNAPEEYLELIKSLTIGEQITISYGVTGDERWKNVKMGFGAIGGMLIENGEINTKLEAGANPRTAIGIKKDGSVLLYTIDGRKKGYSYGVQLKTLANRLKELGCVDAVNLDGGGSTSFVMQFPGEEHTVLNNKPSDGKSRAVSNFIFFKNNLKPTNELDRLTIYPMTAYVLNGASVRLDTKANDSSYYKKNINSVKYEIDDKYSSTIDENGLFTSKDDGKVTIYANYAGLVAEREINCIKTPTDIKITNEDTKSSITSLTIKRNESVNLKSEAFYNYTPVMSNDENFVWECDESIGSITNDGVFTASDVLNAEGKVYITAGDFKKELNVKVTRTGKENEDELYTQIEITNDDNIVKAKLISNYGINVSYDDITVKADGKKIDFKYENDEITFTVTGQTSKISIFVTNSEKMTTFETITLNSTTYESPFTDTKGHWAESIISYMYENKIINGEITDEGLKFNPSQNMTRAEFAVMITNYLGISKDDYSDVILPYADIEEIREWSINSFRALYKLGIIKGSEINGKIYAEPTKKLTREEACTIISRTLPLGIKAASITSSDKDDISKWAYDGMKTLVSLKAINGYPDGTIKPRYNVTRSEALKILYSIL